MTEEQRAADFRASLVRRRAAERTRARLLAGSPIEARELHDDWRAIQDYLRDRENSDDRKEERDPNRRR